MTFKALFSTMTRRTFLWKRKEKAGRFFRQNIDTMSKQCYIIYVDTMSKSKGGYVAAKILTYV
ncbi:MAG TPA: hypothetical protein DEF06_10790 [Clostridiales bacterium]|nr:hypothetical protein [Clostridiales bacterium]